MFRADTRAVQGFSSKIRAVHGQDAAVVRPLREELEMRGSLPYEPGRAGPPSVTDPSWGRMSPGPWGGRLVDPTHP